MPDHVHWCLSIPLKNMVNESSNLGGRLVGEMFSKRVG
jgi:hypothetical protein